MNNQNDNQQDQQVQDPKRRAAFGKFAAYAAPFTVLALTQKADAATRPAPKRR